MNFKFRKMLPKLMLFLVISIVLIILLLSLNDISEIGGVLKTVEWRWMSVGFIFLLLYILLNPISLYLLGQSKGENKISFKDSILIGSTEYFFNGITPFSTGGQPFQVYAYNKINVKPSRSTGILLMNFVVYQIAIVFLCLLSLIYYKELTQNTVALETMIIIGLTMNILILLLFASLGLSKTVRNVLSKVVSKIFKWRIFKGKLERFISSFEVYCSDAQRTFKALLQQKLKFVVCIITKTSSLIVFYMIPFFILKALKVEVTFSQIALVTAMTAFAIAMTCYIPTPGSSGGIEIAFQSLFGSIAGAGSVAVSGMILWRFLTYYILMLLSFIIYLIFERRTKHFVGREEIIEGVPIENIPEEIEESKDSTSEQGQL